jgi:hypothetical protein
MILSIFSKCKYKNFFGKNMLILYLSPDKKKTLPKRLWQSLSINYDDSSYK